MEMKKTAGIKKGIKIMGNAVSALSMIFVLAALFRMDFDCLAVTDWRAFVLAAAAGVILKTVTVFLSALAWCLWLEYFAGRRCARREALRVYAKANIGKYLPGNVMHYVERNLFAAKLNLSHKQVASASACEIVSLVFAAFLLGACLDFADFPIVWRAVMRSLPFAKSGIVWIIVPAAAVCIAAGVYALRRARRRQDGFLALREGGQDGTGWFLWFCRTFLRCFWIYAAVLFLLGAILAAFYWYLGGQPNLREALRIIAAYMIAWVLGFVIPGAPGGIGVREMALTLLLSPVTGRDTIVVLGVLHRLVTVLGDVLAYFLRNLK